MSTGVYFQSWSSGWTSDPTKLDLANIDKRINIVYISFVDPKTHYGKGDNKFSGTGLSFSMDFAVVKKAIAILTGRGVKVLLSVGGATFPWPSSIDYSNATSIWALCQDLGCSGIDVDWEDSYSNGSRFTGILETLGAFKGKLCLSAACWSTGAMTPNGSTYQGMNIDGLKKQGSKLDWVNVMSYDAGNPSMYDMTAAYKAYQSVYSGPIHMGLEVGTQGWGGYLIQMSDVKTAVALSGHKVFVWAYQKAPNGTPSITDILAANA